MKLVSREEMQAMDRIAIEERGVPSLSLMENAGKGVAELILKEFGKTEDRRQKTEVAVICGRGNNGGDGFVVARHLAQAGVSVKVYLLSPEEEYRGDALVNLNRLPIPALPLHNEGMLRAYGEAIRKARLIVDAILGTGLDRPVQGFAAQMIRFLNETLKPIIAIDIPSGLCADTGKKLGEAIRATLTATLQWPKLGLVFGPDSELSGAIRVIPIGTPEDLENKVRRKQYLITPEDFRDCFRPRRRESHKGSYGHVLTVAGSRRKIGAALLAARSALRAGAGLSTLALPECAYEKINPKFAELMFEPQEDDGEFFSQKALPSILKLASARQTIALGPGMGVSGDLKRLISGILKQAKVPCVVDADGLNNLSGDLSPLKRRHPSLILTPHPGEMMRLLLHRERATGQSPLQKNPGEIVTQFAKQYRLHLVLKGYRTLVATSDGSLYVNSTGNPGMATAGAGDVLTGIISGLLAQGFHPEKAALAGVWIHGRAGDLMAKEKGEVGMVAWDIAEKVPFVIREIMTDEK